MAITSSTMKHASFAALALLSTSASASSLLLTPRQAPTEDYINSVCRPELPEDTNTSSAFVVPPCIAVETIESLCQPNGTSPLALEAHAQCMCGGTFFSQWRGCQDCQVFHGARSEQDVDHFAAALAIASKALCGAKPTAKFQELFESANYVAPYPTTGASTSKDAKPSDAAVSLYFTPSASSWGPGPITGSATGATGSAGSSQPTATFTGGETNGPPVDTGSGSSQPTGTTTTTSRPVAGQSGSTTISTTAAPGMAAPTAGAGVRGLLIAVAGGAMAAVL